MYFKIMTFFITLLVISSSFCAPENVKLSRETIQSEQATLKTNQTTNYVAPFIASSVAISAILSSIYMLDKVAFRTEQAEGQISVFECSAGVFLVSHAWYAVHVLIKKIEAYCAPRKKYVKAQHEL